MEDFSCEAYDKYWKLVWTVLPDQIKNELGNNPNNLFLYPAPHSPLSSRLSTQWLPEDPIILAIAKINDHLIMCGDCRKKHEIHCVNFSIGCNVPYFMGVYFSEGENNDELLTQIFGDSKEIVALQFHFMFHQEGDVGFCEYCNTLYRWDQKRRCRLADDHERGRRRLL